MRMTRRARVTLRSDPYGLHGRPCFALSNAISGLSLILKFAREGKEFEVDAGFPVLGVMAAAAGLGLANGVSFEITCEGQDAEAAFERLRQVFTTGHFEGSSFEPLGDLTNG